LLIDLLSTFEIKKDIYMLEIDIAKDVRTCNLM